MTRERLSAARVFRFTSPEGHRLHSRDTEPRRTAYHVLIVHRPAALVLFIPVIRCPIVIV
jgi:hypothetical protein